MILFLPALFLVALETPPQDDASNEARRLVESLRSESIETRDAAMRRLKELGILAKSALEKAALDGDPGLAKRASTLLRWIEIRDQLTADLRKTIKGVEERLASGDEHAWTEVFLEATAEMWEEQKKKAYSADRVKLKQKDVDVLAVRAAQGAITSEEKIRVAWGIRQYDLRSAGPSLLAFLSDADPKVRNTALGGLSQMRVPESLSGIIKALDDPETIVEATAALQGFGARAKVAVPKLCSLLGHRDPRVRSTAVSGLGSLGAKEAVPELVATLKEDPESRVRTSIAYLLGNWGRKEAIPEITKLLQEKDVVARATAIRALVNLDVTEAVPQMIDFIEDPSPVLRMEAIRAAGILGAVAGIPKLIKAAQVPDEPGFPVRAGALQSLGRLRAKDALPLARKLLGDPDEAVRIAAAKALCELGDSKGSTLLLQNEEDLAPLNALRQPQAWERLQATMFVSVEAVHDLAWKIDFVQTKTGMTVERAAGYPQTHPLPQRSGRLTLLEALRDAIDERYELVLESERIRILPREDALKFWKAWWREEQEKENK